MAVVLTDGALDRVLVAPQMELILDQIRDCGMIAVDIPIGLPEDGGDWPRSADLAARRCLRRRAFSVFLTPPRPVLESPAFVDANDLHRRLTGKGLTQQAWNLGPRIREVDALAAHDGRLVEAHPELSFAALAAGGAIPVEGLRWSKKSWNGQHRRRQLLAGAGIHLPERLEPPAGKLPADDLLDAAAAAWTADRIADDRAQWVGEPTPDGRPNRSAGRIWV